jgi:aspartyl-tRNA(Asn)/glutamyl-tRNA(Gln) amidotransferase subunit A
VSIYITEVASEGGPRLAVKDLFDTAGVRTTYGSRIFAGHVPAASAEAVLRAEAAGYVVTGKANLHEFAYGISSENEHHGRIPNPLDATRSAGGSSGGSAAAVAAGLADAALGTDSGGSIRIPAACCGVTGFKPTFGRVSVAGCWPLAPSFDVAGPMARDVARCEALFSVLVDDHAPEATPDLRDLRVGLAWTEHADPLVRARVEEAAARFGSVVRLDLPLYSNSGNAFGREAATVHADLFRDHRDAYSANVAAKLAAALTITDAEYDQACRDRTQYAEQLADALSGVDLLITPALAMVAPPAGPETPEIRERSVLLTFPFNATGAPALALPCGAAEHGLPASVQLAGRPGQDALVLAAGRAVEAALRPPPEDREQLVRER